MTENTENKTGATIAFIIDNRVVDIINTDERLAAIMLSEPLVIDITGMKPGENGLFVSSYYDSETQSFTPPKFDEEGNLV
jgi:hypothetical protein